MVFFSCLYLSYKFSILIIENGWLMRSDFFGDGIYAPSVIDFIISEIIFYIIIISILLGGGRWWYVLFFLLCSFVYYTRASLTLLLMAIFISPSFSSRLKIALTLIGIFLSFVILMIRHGGEMPSSEDINLYFFTYAFVGVGRLLTVNMDFNLIDFSSLTLFFRPFGFLTFIIDYIYQLNGALSIERYAGGFLSDFVYIPLLRDYYNAFGTILFPYIFSFGFFAGILVFLISIFFEYVAVRFFFKRSDSVRILLFILLSGFLFSWCAPFIWSAPFFYKILRNANFNKFLH
jgi:hypothetical protein